MRTDGSLTGSRQQIHILVCDHLRFCGYRFGLAAHLQGGGARSAWDGPLLTRRRTRGAGAGREMALTTLARRLRCVTFGELGTAELARWRLLQDADPGLASAYFHPTFVSRVAATDDRVRVVVGEDSSGEIVSFLPVQISGRRVTAAGWPAADFQGPICLPGTPFDPHAVLQACRATTLRLDHLRAGAVVEGAECSPGRVSPFIDLSGGIESYLARVSSSGKKNLKAAERSIRKIDNGEGFTFVTDSKDHGLLDRLIGWKRRQYDVTGARDYLADPAHRRLLHDLLDTQEPDFAGQLTAVCAGPDPVSVHFGIRRRGVLHWWFPAYDPEYARLGPGWVLLRAVAEHAAELGITRLDLGRGEDDYKRRAMTGHELVHELDVDRNLLRRKTVRAARRFIEHAKQSPIGPTLSAGVRAARRSARARS